MWFSIWTRALSLPMISFSYSLMASLNPQFSLFLALTVNLQPADKEELLYQTPDNPPALPQEGGGDRRMRTRQFPSKRQRGALWLGFRYIPGFSQGGKAWGWGPVNLQPADQEELLDETPDTPMALPKKNCDKTQKLKFLQNSKKQNCDKTQKLKLWQNSTNQIVTKLQNPKLWQ